MADAILFAWYPGEQGGNALADIIFGDINPSGRLPVTFYKSVNDLPDFENYNMDGRTYRYYEGEPLYPFGFGLSYTAFEYKNLKQTVIDNQISLQFELKNAGEMAGEEVVQVYVRKIDPQFWRPIKQLVGYQRVSLQQNEESKISIDIDKKQLQYWDVNMQQYKVESGKYEFQIGSSSEDIRIKESINCK
jgi:beta-glucosidase